jgi:multicomponent Na+:H+ antiporter subunit E
MRCLTLNLIIAVIWLLFSQHPSVPTFIIGFALGTGLIALFQPVLPRERYLGRVLGAVRFVGVFLREFVLANIELLRTVLFLPKEKLHPNLVTVDVHDLTKSEILLLTHCISLTPGSVTVQIETDFQTILVHALNGRDPEQVRRQIKNTFVRAILRFSRA